MLLTCAPNEYEVLSSIFRLRVIVYEDRLKSCIEGNCRPFDNTIPPTAHNVGINEPLKVFDYIVDLPKPKSAWSIRTYADTFDRMDNLNETLQAALVFLIEYTERHNLHILYNKLVMEKWDIVDDPEMDFLDLSDHMKKKIADLIRQNISVMEEERKNEKK
jgi:hypothetical protein